ncbi:MAG: FKBP-type peptidyl-prolyl cis-trans isomerase [Phycisphaerales bacterium]|jgi:peptidylprolyl isomerase
MPRHTALLGLSFAALLAGLAACEEKKPETPATTTAKTTTPAPKTDAPKAPESKPAETKPAETPKPADAPKADAPKPAETPKTETPKTDTPKPEKEPAVTKPAPVTTADGMIVEDLVVGTGKECPKGATVTIHYRGTLTDGTEFDSSYKRNQQATFPLTSLIKGWQEGIPGMKVGGKRKLIIPYQLAYGEAGRPPVIPPKATLVFEIELFDCK